jgi:hypothetical protein
MIGSIALLATCAHWQREIVEPPRNKKLTELPSSQSLDAEIAEFQQLAETSLVYRSRMLKLASELKQKKSQPLSGRELETLRTGTRAYLDLREQLFDVATRYEFATESEQLDRAMRLKALTLSVAAALTLYDNYLSAVHVFAEDDRLRRLINDPDSGFAIDADKLNQLVHSAASIGNRQRMRRAINYIEKYRKRQARIGSDALADDEAYAYVATLVDQSPSYSYVNKIQVGAIADANVQFLEAFAFDFVSDTRDESVNSLSLVFGNVVGLYESRKGKLYQDLQASTHLTSELQPLDILLEKTPFRLTDKFIPGHFGHVAIWLGTQRQLQAIGVWDDPIVARYHHLLRPVDGDETAAALIVEALRPGVQLSHLEHFMNVDDVAILRPVSVRKNPEATKEAIRLALRQVGKDYDFNFDVNTTDRIVCSELVYVSFPTLDWPTDSTLGRNTISPDQVARIALETDDLEPILFYHDGKLVPQDQTKARMRELMGHEPPASGSPSP